MITGIDYILYTDKDKDTFIEKIEESIANSATATNTPL